MRIPFLRKYQYYVVINGGPDIEINFGPFDSYREAFESPPPKIFEVFAGSRGTTIIRVRIK